MPFNLGAIEIEGACPKCSHKFKEPVRRFEAQDTITCRECGEEIQLVLKNPEELRRAQRTADNLGRAMDDLVKTFNRLGKR